VLSSEPDEETIFLGAPALAGPDNLPLDVKSAEVVGGFFSHSSALILAGDRTEPPALPPSACSLSIADGSNVMLLAWIMLVESN